MKREKEKILFSILATECGFGQFSIVEKKDLLVSMPTKIQIDEEQLSELVNSLERQGYLEIKYEDESVFCLSLAKVEIEQQKREVVLSFKKIFLCCLFGGFLGGLLGSTLILLIFNL